MTELDRTDLATSHLRADGTTFPPVTPEPPPPPGWVDPLAELELKLELGRPPGEGPAGPATG